MPTPTVVALALVLATASGCYPAFRRTTVPPILPDPAIPADVRNTLNAYSVECAKRLDGAREDAHDAHKAQYYAGLFGSSATMATGTGAGVLGGVKEETASAIVGGASLASGLVTLWLVNEPAIEKADAEQLSKTELWNAMVATRRVYETSIISGDEAARKAAITEFVRAMTACGLAPPPPGLLR